VTTDYSPFAPPTLGDAPGGATPAPPPSTPSLPQRGAPTAVPLPTLAPPPVTAPAPVPTPVPATLAPTGAPESSATAEPSAAPPSEPPRSRRALVLLLLLGIVTIAGAVWFALLTTDDDGAGASVPPPPSTLDIEAQDISSPVVAPIDDALVVASEIDDNAEEAEALDLLGLDETGDEVADAAPVLGHRFTWSYGTDQTATITVDATTGDYASVAQDGIEWRRVDGQSYGRRSDTEWTEVDGDLLESVPRLGLDAPITIDQVLDVTTSQHAASDTEARDDGTSVLTAEVDAFEYAAEQSATYLSWMSLFGHPANGGTVQPGDVVVIQAELAADGRTIDALNVTTATFTTSYTLDEVFETAPEIQAPTR